MQEDFGIVKCIVMGRLGCFTDPAAKVERVSYPIITPRASQALLARVHGKPEFNWQILEIEMLNDLKYYIEQRKENNNYTNSNITLRKTKYVLNPKYRITARPVATAKAKEHGGDFYTLGLKHHEQFVRNLGRGRYWGNPCMGLSQLRAEIIPDDNSISNNYCDEFRMFYGWSQRREALFFDAAIKNGKMKVPDNLFNNTVFNYNR